MFEPANLQLTAEETQLIQRHLQFYRALDHGEWTPSTPAQHHFVAVCRCQAKAITPHEIAYIKYRLLDTRQRSARQIARDDIDELGEGVPKPGWFTDEGWKRMRGQYLSNSD